MQARRAGCRGPFALADFKARRRAWQRESYGGAPKAWLLLAAILLLLLATPAAAADVADGLTAYRAKDYAAAYRILLPLAQSGDARAQYWLSLVLSARGRVNRDGKEADDAEAAAWLRESANQGYGKALETVGQEYREAYEFDLAFDYSLRAAQADGESGTWTLAFMYCFGQGVPRDSLEADAWQAIGFSPFTHNVEAWQGLQCETPEIVTPEYLLQVNRRARQIRREHNIPFNS